MIADLGSDGYPPPADPVVAAALLHDVGKIESGIGTWARAAVTIVAMVIGRGRVAAWSPTPERPRRRWTSAPGFPGGGGPLRHP